MSSPPKKRSRCEEGDPELTGDGELDRQLSARIYASSTGLWAQSQAYYDRSLLRSRIGLHREALIDARQCLRLFPSEAKVRPAPDQ